MRRLLSTLAIVPFLVPCAAIAGDDIKNVDEVIAKYIEAIGGRSKIDAIKSMRATGKSVMGGGMETPMVIEQKRPASMRVEFTFQGMTGIQAFDGETGWFVMPFAGKTEPEKMPDEMVKLIADQADMDGPLVDYQKKGHKVELIGKEDLEGSEAYKLKITKKNGDVENHFLDAEHFLPLQVSGQREIQGTPVDYKISFGDYKNVGGMMFAHSITQQAGPMGGNTMIMEKIEVNIDIPDDHFKMPPPSPKPESAEPAEKPETGDDDDDE